MAEKLILNWFKNLSKSDVALAGGKGASLGEMTQAGIPVPNGFVVLAESFEKFLEETDLNVELDSILDNVNHKEMESIEVASEKIKALILNAKMPADIKKEILKFHKELGAKFVAVRSSATSEDSSSAAWAGQLDSFLNTKKEKLIENVKRCWASLFTPRAIFYRFEKGLHGTKISVAVVVQKMVESEISGIAFSVHPVTQDRNQLIIEAGFGLGEAIVSGQITPDSYVVEKAPRRIIDKNVSAQERGLYKVESGGNEWKSVKEKGAQQKLSDEQIFELSEIILRIENHYKFPCDIEWAQEGGKFFIVQSRPITTLTDKSKDEVMPSASDESASGIIQVQENLSEVEPLLRSKKEIQQVPGYILPLASAAESTSVMQEYLGFGYKNFLFQYENDGTDMAYFSEDLHNVYAKLNENYKKNKNYYKKIKADFEKQFKNRFGAFKKKKQALLASNKDEDLFELLSDAAKLMGEGVGSVHFIEAVSMTQTHPLKEMLSKKVKDPKELIEVLNIITLPEKASFLAEYQLELKKAFAIKDKKKQKKAFESVIANYYWVGNGYSGKKELTTLDLLTQKGQLGNVKHQDFSKVKKLKKKVIKKFKLDKETVELAELLSFLTVLQDERKECILRSVDELGLAVSLVAKRLGVSEKDLMMLSPQEVHERKYLSKNFREEIKERSKYSLVVYFNDPTPHCKIFFGEENKKKIKHMLEEKAQDNMNAIYGTCASTGRAVGRVQICKNLQEINSFEEGNVLVASMTRPEYLPAMRKAVAIITDEGGLTSHAAIVARELGVPCVIGTKNATKVLHNEDLVEVRANHGEIIILERGKKKDDSIGDGVGLLSISSLPSFVLDLDSLKSRSLSVEHIDCRWAHLDIASLGFTTPFMGKIVPFSFVCPCIKGVEMDWVTDREDQKKIALDLFKRDSEDKNFFADLHKEFLLRLEEMFNFFYKNMDEDYSKLSDLELAKKLKEIWEMYTKRAEFAAFIDGFMFYADERLNSTLKEFAIKEKTVESANNLFSTLSAPVDESFMTEAENDLIEIALAKKAGKMIDELLEKHCKKYSYISSGYGDYRAYTQEEVVGKVDELLKKDSIAKSFPSIENKSKKDALMKKYSFSEEVLQLVRLTELFTKWQDERKQTTTTHVCLEAKIIEQLHQRKKIDLNVLKACHYSDLFEVLDGKPVSQKVLMRSKDVALEIIVNGKVVLEANGKEASEFVSNAKGVKDANVTHIYGLAAYLGKVTGRAKIVNTFEDSKKIQEGDILVISMTRPEHTPIMKKVAAIITDDGGITCHAAIIARELKKPCIIGTKISTHVLKDGDLVEVNANHGQVNILERAEQQGKESEMSTQGRLPIDPAVELLKWGSIPLKLFYISDFGEVMFGAKLYETYPGYMWPKTLIIFRNDLGLWLNEMAPAREAGKRIFVDLILNKVKREEVRKKFNKARDSLLLLEREISNINLPSLSEKDFYNLWQKFMENIALFWVHGYIPELANYGSDEYLKEKLHSFVSIESDLALVMEVLTAPEKLSFYQEEEIDLAKSGNLAEHQKKYFWIRNSYAGVSVAETNFFKERKQNLNKGIEKEVFSRLEEVKGKKNEVRQKYSLSPEVMDIAEGISDCIAWQDHRKGHIFKYLHYKDLLLSEAARRLNLNKNDLLNFCSFEVTEMLKGKDFSNTLVQRHKEFGLFWESKGVEFKDYDKTQYYWKSYNDELVLKASGSLSGIVVSKGKSVPVQGKARIVFEPHKVKVFEKGSILIASMTSPEYIYLMRKAAAVVTDSGGITSHAAIVSRELNIPCIVNTKYATKIFKDGDLIEVNPITGVISALNGSKSNDTGQLVASQPVFFDSKEKVIDYLKTHKVDFQNANCPLFPPDYVFPAYVNSDSVHGSNYSPTFAYYLDNNFYQIMPEEVLMGASRKVYAHAMRDMKWYAKLLEEHLGIEKKIDSVWNKNYPISRLSNEELYDVFIKITTLGREWWKYAAFGEDKGKIIDEEIVPIFEKNHELTKSEATELVSMLSHPENEAIFTGERKTFYRACIKVLAGKKVLALVLGEKFHELKKHKEFLKLFSGYKKKYFYSKTSFAYGKEILFEEFYSDVKKEIKGKTKADLEKELSALESEARNIHAKKKLLFSKHKLSSEEKKLIHFASMVSEWLDYRKRGMMKQFYYIFCIFHEYEKRLGYSFNDLMSLTYEELKVVLQGKTKPDYEELKRRKEPFFAVYEKGIAAGKFYYGKEGAELYATSKSLLEASDSVKGFIASRGSKGNGKVSGIARIVINPSKEKFNDGEILVTSMTRIEFVPLMRKAKAIITDEGGIACHAAIVSRELGVPCIIGTKNATSRIKNGEKIELDLEKGEIRLIYAQNNQN